MSVNGTVRLTDLNDFIAPSQECIRPIVVQRRAAKGMRIAYEEDGTYMEVEESGEKKTLERAQITLNDCLACSGCITSAEAVLVEQQGPNRLLELLQQAKIGEKRQLVVVSVSPQSRASISARCGLSLEQTNRCLNVFFKSLGVDVVLDTNLARNLSLVASGMEFVERYRSWKAGMSTLPVLTGICPGWVCYAEKSLKDEVISLLSAVRSPQAIMGALVKDYLLQSLQMEDRFLDYSADSVIHVTVMPCFDKKLEASRADFQRPDGSMEVDLVLSSGQLFELIQDKCENFRSLHLREDAELAYALEESLYNHKGSGSGGYLEFVYTYAAKELFDKDVSEVIYVEQRNKDCQEVKLVVDGEQVLNMALCYGFKNIQNLVRKIRSGKCKYHYVEVMACPSGCLNGGGQLRSDGGSWSAQVLHRVSDLYHSAAVVSPSQHPIAMKLTNEWLGSLHSAKAEQCLTTKYRALKEQDTFVPNVRW